MRSHAKAASAGSNLRQAAGLGRTGIVFACLLALLAFGGSSASSAGAVVDKGVNGAFGPLPPTILLEELTGGRLRSPGGIAVNQSDGRVYVAESDGNNSRISVFGPSGEFLRAFGKDVVESGPGNTGTGFEICVPAEGDVCKRGLTSAPQVGGVMNVPRGVSLDASGNVYVSDQDNRRVQKFDADGNFILAFGQDVVEAGPGNTGTGFEICVAADGDVCKAGVSASTGGAFAATFDGYLAVAPVGAPNAGNVLVADPANLRVQEFTASGAFVRAFGFDVVAGGGTAFEVCEVAAECKSGTSGSEPGQFSDSVDRVAEDAAGNIYTVEGEPNFRVQKFTLPGNVVTPQGAFAPGILSGAATTAPTDVAIDPASGNVLVTKEFPAGSTASCPSTGSPSPEERRVIEVSAAGALEATHMACAGIDVANGLAVRGSTGDVFVSSTTGGWGIYGLNTPLVPPSAGISGVSDVDAHNATVSGFVNPNGPATVPYGFTTAYRIEFKRTADATFSQTAAFDVGKGTTNVPVSKRLGGLEAGTSYDVRIVAEKPFAGTATTATITFLTPSAPPEVGIPRATTAATEDGQIRAALYGTVTPNSEPTAYRFEYGTTASYGAKAPVPDQSVGAGAATVPVAQFVEGLEPGTTYHFRLVAENATGSSASPDRTFTTPEPGSPGNCPNEARRVEQGSTHLPDCRAFELVTPADKGSAGSVTFQVAAAQQQTQASRDGESFIYPLTNGLDSSTAGGWLIQRAGRGGSGWSSAQVSGPSLVPPPEDEGLGIAKPSQVHFTSPDNSCSVLETYNPLTADTPPASVELGLTNLYRWSPEEGYELLIDRLPLNPEAEPDIQFGSGGYYRWVDASDDCRRVFFSSQYDFLAGADSGLYESDEGTLRDAGVLPNGEVGSEMNANNFSVGGAILGGGSISPTISPTTTRFNAVSPDGSRVFFTAIPNEGPSSGRPAVFMRTDGGATVVEISRSQTAVPTNGARFEGASADGGRVFFRANYGIADTTSSGRTNERCGALTVAGSHETDFDTNPKLEQKSCDLYAYDVQTGELSDLSADANPADQNGAQIQGTVAVDHDGSHVYFAALGQLIPGKGRTYAENTASESANVYLSQSGELSYVTTLAGSDLLGTTAAALMRMSQAWRANVSADGGELLFASSLNLAGWESGGGDKYAAYLYSAADGGLTCLSCRLDGLPSVAASGQSSFLLARPEIGGYRPRSISEDGSRAIFTSPDVLAQGAVEGKRNVYQWQQGQVSFLATADGSGLEGLSNFRDMSADGDDVFIATGQRLAPQDVDFISDIYNVRVNGGFAMPPVPVECQVDESIPLLANQTYCQGERSAQPGDSSPASAGFAGAGNVSEKAGSRCNRRAQALSRRAKALRHRANRASSPKATRRNANRARRAAKAARRNSKAAKRCRQRARRANANRGGNR